MNQELIMMFNGDDTVRLAADSTSEVTDGVIAALYNEMQQSMQVDSEGRQIVVIDEAQNIVASNFGAYKDVEGFKVDDTTALVSDGIAAHTTDVPSNGVNQENLIIMDDDTAVSLTDENCLKSKNLDMDAWKMGLLETNGIVPHNEEEEPFVEQEPEPEKQSYQLWECPKCTALFRDKETCELHVVKAHDFKCGLCEEPFQEKEELENHIIKHIADVPGHDLQFISKPTDVQNSSAITSETEGTLKNQPTASSGNNFICSTCGLSFMSRQNLEEHEGTHVEDELAFQTQEPEPSLAAQMISSVEGEPTAKSPQFTCDICDKVCFTKNALLLHMNKRHCSPSANFTCDECGQGFKWKLSLQNHMVIQHHTKKRCFSCSVCDQVCNSPEDLTKHMSLHKDENLFPCDTCGVKFKQSASLLNHVRLMHPNLQEFSCGECGKSFKIKKFLEAHILEVHSQREGNRCRICLKSFMSISSLTNHMSTHHLGSQGKKKYSAHACALCNMSFSDSKDLERHMTSHTPGVGKFICELCGKGFHNHDNLSAHINTHSEFSVVET